MTVQEWAAIGGLFVVAIGVVTAIVRLSAWITTMRAEHHQRLVTLEREVRNDIAGRAAVAAHTSSIAVIQSAIVDIKTDVKEIRTEIRELRTAAHAD